MRSSITVQGSLKLPAIQCESVSTLWGVYLNSAQENFYFYVQSFSVFLANLLKRRTIVMIKHSFNLVVVRENQRQKSVNNQTLFSKKGQDACYQRLVKINTVVSGNYLLRPYGENPYHADGAYYLIQEKKTVRLIMLFLFYQNL